MPARTRDPRLAATPYATWEEVVARLDGLLMATAYGYSHDREIARCAVQDTYQRMFLSVEKYRPFGRHGKSPERDFSGWARTICENVCRDERRSARRSPITVPAAEVADSRGSAGPADAFVEQQLSPRLLAAWMQVYPVHRVVIFLRALQELSTRETAEVMGAKEGTVQSGLARGLTTLRTAFMDGDGAATVPSGASAPARAIRGNGTAQRSRAHT